MKLRILLFIFIIALLLYGMYYYYTLPVAFANLDSELIISDYPMQIDDIDSDPILVELGKGKLYYAPQAWYSLTARVLSKKRYHSGWTAQISPYDLALAWGDFAQADFSKYVKFSQFLRYYLFKTRKDSPYSIEFISRHSSNNHIIPATNNLKRVLSKIRKDQIVNLEGLLVNVRGHFKKRPVSWNTSLSREDTGEGGCEIFYVTQIRIGSNIYK